MIQVKKLCKSFDSQSIIENLDMTVEENKIYGLVGMNGTGKTTLLKLISGVYKASSGSVEIDGENVYENNKIKSQLFFISDEPFFFKKYTVKDMFIFYKSIYEHFDCDKYDALIKQFKIDENKPMSKFSKGLKKQIDFIFAIASKAKVIILDEPVDGLDPFARKMIWRLIKDEIEQRGVTIVISSHNLRELENVCDTIGIMYDGTMIIEKKVEKIIDHTHKVQVIIEDEKLEDVEKVLKILKVRNIGRVKVLIIEGDHKEVKVILEKMSPSLCDFLPMTLEEVFIYTMEGVSDEYKEIII